ncbi:hypothetical protein, partial [Klebsiella pneumoniae]|uniref:hypothetical protein n=1 Tax=Klebsiella pneumoniae TaxID=573 RepID=UPI00358FE2D9
ETLLPARAYYNDLKEMHRRRGDDEALKLGVDSFRESRRQALIEARLREMDVRDRGLLGEEAQRRAALDNHTERLAELELQRREQGGERIEELEREQGRAEAERDRRQAKREQARQAAQQLGAELPDDAHGFAELVER